MGMMLKVVCIFVRTENSTFPACGGLCHAQSVVSLTQVVCVTWQQIFTQFIIYKGFGKNCHHDDGTDEERKPLLPSANGGDRGFPCLGERGSIQAPPPQEGPKNGKTS